MNTKEEKVLKKRNFANSVTIFSIGLLFFLALLAAYVPNYFIFNFAEEEVCHTQQPFFKDMDINQILSDNQFFWIATHRHGLIRVHKEDKDTVFFTKTNSVLPSNTITTLLEGRNASLLVGTNKGLVNLYKENPQIGTHYHPDNLNWQLPSSVYITDLTRINKDIIFIGTTGGLIQWKRNVITPLLSDTIYNSFALFPVISHDLSNSTIKEIEKPALIDRPHRSQWTIYTTNNSALAGNYITTLTYDKITGLYIGTKSGLNRIKNPLESSLIWESLTSSNSNLTNHHITAVTITEELESSNGKIFIATPTELLQIKGNLNNLTGSTEHRNDLSIGGIITDMIYFDGVLSIATNGGGFIEYNLVHKKEVKLNKGNSILTTNAINALWQTPNDTYLATEEGLFVISKNNEICNIYPGDLDRNGIVNHEDLLMIGLGMNAVGPARLNDFNSIAPQCGTAWPNSIDTINYVYIDANGDGVINSLDTSVLSKHYNRQYYSTTSSIQLEKGIIEFMFEEVHCVPSKTDLSNEYHLSFDVYLKMDGLKELSIYGLAFTLHLTDGGKVNQVMVDFNSSDLGIIEEDLLSLTKVRSVENGGTKVDEGTKIDIAITKTKHQGKEITIGNYTKISNVVITMEDIPAYHAQPSSPLVMISIAQNPKIIQYNGKQIKTKVENAILTLPQSYFTAPETIYIEESTPFKVTTNEKDIRECVWSVNGNEVSTEEDLNYVFSKAGRYTVGLEVYPNNESLCSDYYEQMITVLEPVDKQSVNPTTPIDFSIYPNPTHDYLYLQFDQNVPAESITVRLQNMRTIKVYPPILYNKQSGIDVQNLEPGIYMITIFQNGNFLGTKKILIN